MKRTLWKLANYCIILLRFKIRKVARTFFVVSIFTMRSLKCRPLPINKRQKSPKCDTVFFIALSLCADNNLLKVNEQLRFVSKKIFKLYVII